MRVYASATVDSVRKRDNETAREAKIAARVAWLLAHPKLWCGYPGGQCECIRPLYRAMVAAGLFSRLARPDAHISKSAELAAAVTEARRQRRETGTGYDGEY